MGNNIRSSQLLSPFGIGQIVNFPGEQSYMICGLHLWDSMIEARRSQGGNIDEKEIIIREPRLEKLLNVRNFKKPFLFKKVGSVNTNLEIPGVRFPTWHYCTNTKCGKMRQIAYGNADKNIYCKFCEKSKYKFKLLPVRFIAACPDGHIQDIPFKEWVHDQSFYSPSEDHTLSYHAGSGSGDLSSITIKCTCKASKRLGGIMNISKSPDGSVYNSALASIGLKNEEKLNIDAENPNHSNQAGQYCSGNRPWLGPDIPNANCSHHLQVIIRGGSNIHYSDIISALYLPESDTYTNKHVGKIIEDLGLGRLTERYKQSDDHRMLLMTLEDRPEILNNIITLDEAYQDIERLILAKDDEPDEEVVTEIELRQQEYNYILKERNSENADYKSTIHSFKEYKCASFLNAYFEKVVLIEKLKETRVFSRFARISPNNKVDTSELSANQVTWLPATQIFGEGIFLEFKEDKIDLWLEQIAQFDNNLIDRYERTIRTPNSRHALGLNPAFIMMHTFAHLLIKRLSFNCGYGSSSLKERIYFSPEKDKRMQGVLIYTSAGDSEGSLGGLVRQGKDKYLGNLIKESLADAEWCSADPVCSEIGQTSGQGPDNVNGSACHNCCILPETSCEEFNMLLDRGILIGTHENSALGYFEREYST